MSALKHTHKLRTTRNSLPISLLRTRELIMEDVRPILQNHGITEQQWRVLRVIAEEGTTDASTIAERACILAPSLTRMFRALGEKALIEQVRDPQDARRVLISLTPKGEDFLEAVAPETLQVFEDLRAVVGDERWEQLVAILAAFRQDISNARRENEAL